MSLKSKKYILLKCFKWRDGWRIYKAVFKPDPQIKAGSQQFFAVQAWSCSETFVVLYFWVSLAFFHHFKQHREFFMIVKGRLGLFHFSLEFSSIIKHNDRFYVKCTSGSDKRQITDSQVLLDLLKIIKNLAWVIPVRLPSGQCVHYHILEAIFHQRHFLSFKGELEEVEDQKTKENITPQGKFRLIENDHNAFSWRLTCLIFVCFSANCLNALLTTMHFIVAE